MKAFFPIVLTLVLTQSVLAAEIEVFGWSTHGHDQPYLKKVIERAPEFHVNMLQLCAFYAKHGGNLPTNEQEAADLREVCKLGKEKGVGVYLWVWEINGIPKEMLVNKKVNLDNQATWDWLASKYRKLFDGAPELSGVILTLRECDYPVQSNGSVVSKMTDSQRVAKLVETIFNVCKARGKKLYIRDFSVSPDEMKNIVEAVKLLPAEARTMSKAVARDWHAFLPDNPALEAYKGRGQLVEFDLGSEYNGQGTTPYFVAEEIHHRWENAKKKGAVGTVARIDRFDARIFDNLDEANAYAYEAIVRKGADSQTAAKDYCTKRFGRESAEIMSRCLLRTYDISNKTFFTLHFKFLQAHSAVPAMKYADVHIKSASLATWMPQEKTTEAELLKPTRKTLERVIAEKDEALRLAKVNLQDLEMIRSQLPPKDYEWVKGHFRKSLEMATLWRGMAGAYMAGRVCLTDASAENRALAKQWVDEFRKAIDHFEGVYGRDMAIGEVSRSPRRVVPDCRSLLAAIEARLEKKQPAWVSMKECGP